jgi:hypothetical protein
MNSNDDDISRTIIGKIEREKALINAANAMRQSTDNPMVLNGIDTKIRDGHRNIEYLEGRLREHRMKLAGQRMDNLSLKDSNGGFGGTSNSPAPGASQGAYTPGGEYRTEGGTGIMPPNAPFAKGPPGQGVPKASRNYSRLGMFVNG